MVLDELLVKYRAHKVHSKHVEYLSLMLFDLLKEQGLHDMGDKERDLLKIGAALHDIGYFLGAKGHNKNSAELILKENLNGLGAASKEMVAAIARYHRGNLPNKHHALYAAFTDKKRKKLQKLAGIVRLVDGLDRSHLRLVSSLELKYDKDDNLLWCYVISQNPDVAIDLSTARRKKDLFEKGFELQMVVLEK
jgi:exopolyphosphatase/guanosine-5'-triphosphate,3'-diphosphate pyrophosphatase